MKARGGRSRAARCGGWGTTEYIVVLLGLFFTMARVTPRVVELIREHHREFSWALMLPF